MMTNRSDNHSSILTEDDDDENSSEYSSTSQQQAQPYSTQPHLHIIVTMGINLSVQWWK